MIRPDSVRPRRGLSRSTRLAWLLAACVLVPAAAAVPPSGAFTLPDIETGDWFGRTVAVDGRYEYIAGYAYDHGDTTGVAPPDQPDEGRVFVYDGQAGTLVTTIDSEAGGNHFGTAIAAQGDTVAVAREGGRVEVFFRVGATFTRQADFPFEMTSEALAIRGDVVAMGAWQRGEVAVATREGPWGAVELLGGIPNQDSIAFGYQVAVADGLVFVAAPLDDHDGAADDNKGAVYVFERANLLTPWEFAGRLTNAAGAPNDLFGRRLASDGTRVFVADNNGDVFIFEQGLGGVWSLSDGPISTGVYSPRTMAVAPNGFLLGSPFAGGHLIGEARFFRYDPFATTYVYQATLSPDAPDPALEPVTPPLFAVSGGVGPYGVVIGAPGTQIDAAIVNAGVAYRFTV